MTLAPQQTFPGSKRIPFMSCSKVWQKACDLKSNSSLNPSKVLDFNWCGQLVVKRSVDQISCDIGFDRSPSGRVTKKCHTTSPVPSPNVSFFHISCLSFYFLTLFSSLHIYISSFTFCGSLHTPPFLPPCLELWSSFLTFFSWELSKKHSPKSLPYLPPCL